MSPIHTPHQLGQRAVIIGASIAGLLAARVLAEHFDEVMLLERDALPLGVQPRKGTPHAVHPHGLLARGREVLESLFPGFTEALVARGALLGDLGTSMAFDADGYRLARAEAGHMALAVSRLAIEAELRRRVLALPKVQARTGVDVQEPVFDAAAGRVTGVRFRPADPAGAGQPPVETVDAQFVIDCSGRASAAPSWLRNWGFDAPHEEQVHVKLCSTSAHFQRSDADALGNGIDCAALICAATPRLPRPGVLIAQEPAPDGMPRWVVGVGGYGGDHPQASAEGMHQRALEIGSPELVRLTGNGKRIGAVMRYVFAYSQRRRYERLRRLPGRFLLLGDALTSFNPIYGQGMTVAACEALALRDALVHGLDGAQRSFLKAAAKLIDTPWQLAVGSDLALDRVPGPRPLAVRLANAYLGCLQRAARHDAALALAFLKVIHLVEAPRTLLAPTVLARVLWPGRGIDRPTRAADQVQSHA